MALSMYEVKRIEGKGLGCFATKDIKRGCLILHEDPQIPHVGDENVLALWKSFEKMKEADQVEYMTLHDKFEDIPYDILPLNMKNGKIGQRSVNFCFFNHKFLVLWVGEVPTRYKLQLMTVCTSCKLKQN